MSYNPQTGDIVGIKLLPACPGELKYHGIRPIVNFLLGNVEDIEVPHVEDHLYRVRFIGPIEGREVNALNRKTGVTMHFKRDELILFCSADVCPHEPIVMLSIDSRNFVCVLSTACRTVGDNSTQIEPRKWCELCWDRVEEHDDEGWGHKANEVLM